MPVEIMKMGTNARLVSKVFTKNKNTFLALKELINNSLHAKATRIDINFLQKDENKTFLTPQGIDQIEITDNGTGVPFSKFEDTIMCIATEGKREGYGIGRFSALQIGKTVHISTVGYESQTKEYSLTEVKFHLEQFKSHDLSLEDFPVKHEVSKDRNTGYRVVISDLYHNDQSCPRINKLGQEFLKENFTQKLFEAYPVCIFDGAVRFFVNNEELKKTDFVNDTPSFKIENYKDIAEHEHKVRFEFYSMKLQTPNIHIFLQCNDGEVVSTALELKYNSNWYDTSLGTQYIVIESSYLTRDVCDAFILGELNQEWLSFSKFIKKCIDEHYKKANKKYIKFIEKLTADKSYPFTEAEKDTLPLPVDLFNKSAFIIENDINVLESSVHNKQLIYRLLRKVIEDGNFSFVFEHILGLSKDSRNKLIELLDKTNLEEIICYTSVLAKKQEVLDILEKITVTELNAHTKQYAEIKNLVKRNLWIFGDEYYNSLADEPNQSISAVFDKLFKQYILYKPTKKFNNLLPGVKQNVKSLSSSYFAFSKQLGNNQKEVICINMFAPSFQIEQNEITHINSYIFNLEKDNTIDKDGVAFKIYFIGSHLTEYAKSVRNTSQHVGKNRFLYREPKIGSDNITVYLSDWKGLISYNRELLSCANKSLKLNKIDVEASFLQEYSDLIESKSRSRLNIVKS